MISFVETFQISCTRKDRKSKQAFMRIQPSDLIPHTEMYSPVSPQVGHETPVSKQVNWNTWAIIQDCSMPSATRSAAPIISISFSRGTHHFRFTRRVFTIIHPHLLLSFRRSTQKHCVTSPLILLIFFVHYLWRNRDFKKVVWWPSWIVSMATGVENTYNYTFLNLQCKVFQITLNAKSWFDKEKNQFALPYRPLTLFCLVSA